MSDERDFIQEAKDAAKEMAEHFREEVVRQLIEERADKQTFEYLANDTYRHELLEDNNLSTLESITLLDQLHGDKETDTDLWEGTDPIVAIEIQATYTYANAAMRYAREIMIEILNNPVLKDAVSEKVDSEVIEQIVVQVIRDWEG